MKSTWNLYSKEKNEVKPIYDYDVTVK